MESIGSTRIIDLPENIGGQMSGMPPTHKSQQREAVQSTTYQTIDPHPNPYGHPPPSVPQLPTTSFSNNPQQLPPRDFPKDMTQYTQDEQIQANYIPPLPNYQKNITNEYMLQYEREKEKELKTHEEKKKKKSKKDEIMEQSQLPIFLSILFFLFNMPFINRMFFQRFAFLYEADGSAGAAKGAGIGVGYYASAEEACGIQKSIGSIEPTQVAMYQNLYQDWYHTLLSHI